MVTAIQEDAKGASARLEAQCEVLAQNAELREAATQQRLDALQCAIHEASITLGDRLSLRMDERVATAQSDVRTP